MRSVDILTEEQAFEIYKCLKEKQKGRDIAKKFGVSESTVSAIKHGRLWGNITGLNRGPSLEELAGDEEVRAIPGFDKLYITKSGIVIRQFHGKFKILSRKYTDGYARISINSRHTEGIHRLLCMAFKPVDNSGNLIVRHLDDNPMNNSLDNLEWGTFQDNTDDMVRNGHSQNGEKSWNAKMTEKQIDEIRHLAKNSDLKFADIGKLFGTSSAHISKICRGESWKHSYSEDHVLDQKLIRKKRSTTSKLTDVDVLEIRKLIHAGELTYQEIGQKFGVLKSTITHIANSRTWAWLENEA